MANIFTLENVEDFSEKLRRKKERLAKLKKIDTA